MYTCMKQHRAISRCHSNRFAPRLFLILYFFLKYTGIILYFMLNIITFRELNNPFIDWNRILKSLTSYWYSYRILVFCTILILFCRLPTSLWNWHRPTLRSTSTEEGDIQML